MRRPAAQLDHRADRHGALELDDHHLLRQYLGAFGLNRHWGLAFAMRRWDVERVDLAALGKCGSRIGLVASSARASSGSACEVPVVPVELRLAGGPNLKLAATGYEPAARKGVECRLGGSIFKIAF